MKTEELIKYFIFGPPNAEATAWVLLRREARGLLEAEGDVTCGTERHPHRVSFVDEGPSARSVPKAPRLASSNREGGYHLWAFRTPKGSDMGEGHIYFVCITKRPEKISAEGSSGHCRRGPYKGKGKS